MYVAKHATSKVASTTYCSLTFCADGFFFEISHRLSSVLVSFPRRLTGSRPLVRRGCVHTTYAANATPKGTNTSTNAPPTLVSEVEIITIAIPRPTAAAEIITTVYNAKSTTQATRG